MRMRKFSARNLGGWPFAHLIITLTALTWIVAVFWLGSSSRMSNIKLLTNLSNHSRHAPSLTSLPSHSEMVCKYGTDDEYHWSTKWPFLPEYIALDAELIKHIRQNILIPPSNEQYNLTYPQVKDPTNGYIAKEVYPMFFNQTKAGTFFEAGALDGELLSTTLFFERELGWRGLLAEMTPINEQLVLEKHRKAYFAPVCISPLPWPIQKEMKMTYKNNSIRSRWGATTSKKWINESKNTATPAGQVTYTATVDCYPLQSLLAAAGFNRVDFLSLDLEGVELQVLKTLAWEFLDIKVIHLDLIHTEEGFAATKDFLVSKGYDHIKGKSEPVLFAKKGWHNY